MKHLFNFELLANYIIFFNCRTLKNKLKNKSCQTFYILDYFIGSCAKKHVSGQISFSMILKSWSHIISCLL